MNYSIYAESTPNPGVMKFVANRMLVDKSIEITKAEQAQDISVAKALFNFPRILFLYIFQPLKAVYINIIPTSKDIRRCNILIKYGFSVGNNPFPQNGHDEQDEPYPKPTIKDPNKININKPIKDINVSFSKLMLGI